MLAKSVQPFIDIFRARIFFDQNMHCNQSYLKLRSEEKISIDIFFISIKFFSELFNEFPLQDTSLESVSLTYLLFQYSSIHIFALIFWRLKSFFIFLSELNNGLIHSERRLQTVILVVQKVLPLKPMTLDLLDEHLKKKKTGKFNRFAILCAAQNNRQSCAKLILRMQRNK